MAKTILATILGTSAGVLFAATLAARPAAADAVRIADLADVLNVRSNQLTGIGLVVGLSNTGDQSKSTKQLIANLYRRSGINVDPRDLNVKNAAAVTITATLPPFVRSGARLDAVVSSNNDATSLDGGVLLRTELFGADGEVYALAQGPLSIGGFLATGQAATIQKNHPTVGRLLNGVTVEREVPMRPVSSSSIVDVVLRSPNFVTASRIADAVNQKFPGSAAAIDGGKVSVRLPADVRKTEATGFIGEILSLSIEPEEIARVVVNARTGTVVAGGNVVIRPVAITHGNLNFTVTESPEVSQPGPYSRGTTEVVPRTQVTAEEEQKALIVVPGGVSVKEVAEALNAIGVTPRDLIDILDTLKEAGALHAELVIL